MIDLNLQNNIMRKELSTLSLIIDPSEKESFIKDVKTGSKQDQIAVIAA